MSRQPYQPTTAYDPLALFLEPEPAAEDDDIPDPWAFRHDPACAGCSGRKGLCRLRARLDAVEAEMDAETGS